MIEEGWTFVREGNPRLKGGTDYCWCPVVRKEHNDGSVSQMQSLMSPGESCPWHGLSECKGCGETVWGGGLAHYQSGVNPWTGEGEFTSYYRCQREA